MKIDGKEFKTVEVFENMMTIPDCIVVNNNKIGTGHGEAKFYISSKDAMHSFFGDDGFDVKCFILKKDLLIYMEAIKTEYEKPTQNYRGKKNLLNLWGERIAKIKKLPEVIFFNIQDQNQIKGPRGYINSNDEGYAIIREIALPLVSYIYCELVAYKNMRLYYWKLFVDFDAIWEKENGPLVLRYGKRKSENKNVKIDDEVGKNEYEIRQSRNGQGKYRELLLAQCHACPITGVTDERLLIASHIKPWVVSNEKEKIDPYNGYLLTPLYDKLFDKGYITFTNKRHMILSDFISSYTWKKLNINRDTFIQALPMDEKRIKYLEFHRKAIFKGQFEQ